MGNQAGILHTNTGKSAPAATLTTAWLSMGTLHKPKRLHHISIVLDAYDPDLTLKIEYRVENQTTWTTALASGSGQRVTTPRLNVNFYQLQIRFTLTNSGSATKTTAIAAIAVQYSGD